jgi:hypothetical protein
VSRALLTQIALLGLFLVVAQWTGLSTLGGHLGTERMAPAPDTVVAWLQVPPESGAPNDLPVGVLLADTGESEGDGEVEDETEETEVAATLAGEVGMGSARAVARLSLSTGTRNRGRAALRDLFRPLRG